MLKFKCANLECSTEVDVTDLNQLFNFKCPKCSNTKVIFNQDITLACPYFGQNGDNDIMDIKHGVIVQMKKQPQVVQTPMGSIKQICISRETGELTTWKISKCVDSEYVNGRHNAIIKKFEEEERKNKEEALNKMGVVVAKGRKNE